MKGKETLVVYYSRTGNNKFLAEQAAQRLQSEIEEIRPVLNSHLLFLMGIGLGNKKLKHDLSEYSRIILFGPIWMGRFVYPLKKFVRKNRKNIKDLLFITCCGSDYKMKDQKFGHGLVFNKVKDLFPDINIQCTAFPITLALSEDNKEDPKQVMETRLDNENFKGDILREFNDFIDVIKS